MIGRIIGIMLLLLGFAMIGFAFFIFLGTHQLPLALWFTGFPIAAIGFALAVPEQFTNGPR
jgi:hypothetical protein